MKKLSSVTERTHQVAHTKALDGNRRSDHSRRA